MDCYPLAQVYQMKMGTEPSRAKKMVIFYTCQNGGHIVHYVTIGIWLKALKLLIKCPP